MTTWRDIGYENARRANEELRNQSTINQMTNPMRDVNETLKDIKVILREILEEIQKHKDNS